MGRRAAQADLPSLEDRAILALEALAEEYVDIRIKRMALTTQEVDLKGRIRTEMHKQKRTHYAHNRIEIEILLPDGEDRVKVRVKKPKAEVAE